MTANNVHIVDGIIIPKLFKEKNYYCFRLYINRL